MLKPNVPPSSEGRIDPLKLLSLALLAVGLALRSLQYFSDASLWLDEALLNASVMNRSLPELLTKPLDNGQSAPNGFLLLSWLSAAILGRVDLALRLVSFLSSVVTLCVCYLLSERLLQRTARPLAVGLIALAAPLVLFAGQAKQYACDAAVAPGLLLLVIVTVERGQLTNARAAALATLGAVAAWFSHTAIFVLSGSACWLLWLAWSESFALRRADLRGLVPALGLWGVSCLAAVLVAQAHLTRAGMDFLQNYFSNGYMPLPPWRPEAWLWLVRSFTRIFGGNEFAGLWYPANRLFALVALLGCWSLWRRRREVALILLTPLPLTLLAGAAHLYPVYDRLVLFLVPVLLLAVAEGVERLAGMASHYVAHARLVLMPTAFALAAYPLLSGPPPYWIEDIKPVLAYVKAHRQANEPVYVYGKSRYAFEYYAERYGFRPAGYTLGAATYRDAREHLREMDQFRGAGKLWLVISHALPSCSDPRELLQYLDTIGVRKDERIAAPRKPGNSSLWALSAMAYAYDLSDPARLAAASSATFPLERPGDEPHAGCR